MKYLKILVLYRCDLIAMYRSLPFEQIFSIEQFRPKSEDHLFKRYKLSQVVIFYDQDGQYKQIKSKLGNALVISGQYGEVGFSFSKEFLTSQSISDDSDNDPDVSDIKRITYVIVVLDHTRAVFEVIIDFPFYKIAKEKAISMQSLDKQFGNKDSPMFFEAMPHPDYVTKFGEYKSRHVHYKER